MKRRRVAHKRKTGKGQTLWWVNFFDDAIDDTEVKEKWSDVTCLRCLARKKRGK